MKAVRIDNEILLYYGNRIGRIRGEQAEVDKNFQNQSIIEYLKKQQITRIEWKEGLYDQLLYASDGSEKKWNRVRIWQIQPEADASMKFLPLDAFQKNFGNPDMDHYVCVYEGQIETDDPEEIYSKYHMDLPLGYRGHPIAISDIIERCDEKESSYFYVDRYGLTQIYPDMGGNDIQQKLVF